MGEFSQRRAAGVSWIPERQLSSDNLLKLPFEAAYNSLVWLQLQTAIASSVHVRHENTMHYETIFAASDAPYRNLSFLVPGIVFMLTGLMMVFRPMWFEKIPFFSPSPRGPWFRPFAIVFLLFALIWTIGAGAAILGRDVNAKRALESGNCETIEGRVEHFHPMPKSGHDMERFEVAGVKFEYSDYVLSAGFNNTASHGGPIYEGLPVRICHRDGAILRLEIAR